VGAQSRDPRANEPVLARAVRPAHPAQRSPHLAGGVVQFELPTARRFVISLHFGDL